MAVGRADQGEIVGLAREETERVEALGVGLHTAEIGPAVGPLVGDHAVEGAGPDHRARGLGAVADRHHEIGDRRGRP